MSLPKRDPGFDRLMKILNDESSKWDDPEDDTRLNEGQLHKLVSAVLGGEPLGFAANILALSIDTRSKIGLAPDKAFAGALQIHDRLYGPPEVKKRKVDADTQFQLDFAWASPEPEVVEMVRTAADGTEITTTHAVATEGEGDTYD